MFRSPCSDDVVSWTIISMGLPKPIHQKHIVHQHIILPIVWNEMRISFFVQMKWDFVRFVSMQFWNGVFFPILSSFQVIFINQIKMCWLFAYVYWSKSLFSFAHESHFTTVLVHNSWRMRHFRSWNSGITDNKYAHLRLN